MKKEFMFDLTVDKQNNSIHIISEFAAGIRSVWDAWTNSEILDKWWAPKPYKAETKSFDFSEGGMWLYSMVGPNNERHWSRMDYKSIKPLEQITGMDSFSDEMGNADTGKPISKWTTDFAEKNGKTTVNITLRPESPEALAALIDMGFNEGIKMGLGNLNELLTRR